MGKRVLVVDDDPAIASLNQELLQFFGYQAEACQDVKTALRKIIQDEHDILVTDLNLGSRADGYILAGATKLMRPRATVLLVTGNPDLRHAWKTIQSFVDRVLVKPVKLNQLKDAIEWLQTPEREVPILINLAELIEHYREELIEDWLQYVEADPLVAKVKLSREERLDDLDSILSDIVQHLRNPAMISSAGRHQAAWKHGQLRQHESYSTPALMREASHMRQAITRLIERHFLDISFDNLISDLFTMNSSVDENMLDSLRAFIAEESPSSHPAR